MTESDDAIEGLDLRSRNVSEFLCSIDSRKNGRNPCASQEYYSWDTFLTFTCNMRKRFGTLVIKERLDRDDWNTRHPDWETLPHQHQA